MRIGREGSGIGCGMRRGVVRFGAGSGAVDNYVGDMCFDDVGEFST